MTLSVVIMLALPFSPQPARAEDSMIWALTPLPPAMIEKDGKIVGYGVDILDWFIARMPAITHTKEIVPLARLMQKMTMPGTVCNIGLVPTPERRQFLIFSKAVLPHLPVALITRADKTADLGPFRDDNSNIKLADLLASGRFHGAVRTSRSYGPAIDPILQQFAGTPVLEQVGNDAHFLSMIELGREEWTLYFPAEAEYYRRNSAPELEFISSPIAGNSDPLPASISCTRTTMGAMIIQKIDAIVATAPDMPWTDFYARSLSKSDQRWFEKAQEQFVANSGDFPLNSADQ
ncbi:hypothetical protein [Thalassospira alkalitolerans]|uniref:hypothetical protein n=1 Tax=Thalassospira alkalitolerans TaxID=1293890 RepID=UPI00111C9056|nr:hypothetical protein [Thalassospira alkalitolerans]